VYRSIEVIAFHPRSRIIRGVTESTRPVTGLIVAVAAACAVAVAVALPLVLPTPQRPAMQSFPAAPVLREPTAAELLVIHDWERRFQQPCLAAHGTAAPQLSFQVFLDTGVWAEPQTTAADFASTLAIQLACPSVPEYLHDDGVAGY
jgi:energy-converting hydrogenase Eha subunit A